MLRQLILEYWGNFNKPTNSESVGKTTFDGGAFFCIPPIGYEFSTAKGRHHQGLIEPDSSSHSGKFLSDFFLPQCSKDCLFPFFLVPPAWGSDRVLKLAYHNLADCLTEATVTTSDLPVAFQN